MIDATIHNKAVANKNEGQENKEDLFGSRQDLNLDGDVVMEHDHGSNTEPSRAQESKKHHDSRGVYKRICDKKEGKKRRNAPQV